MSPTKLQLHIGYYCKDAKNLRLTCFKLFSTKYDTKLILKSRAQANLSKTWLISDCTMVEFRFVTWYPMISKKVLLCVKPAYLSIIGICLIYGRFGSQDEVCWTQVKENKKGWKTSEKKVSTSFWVHAALKSWSKYTTHSSYSLFVISQVTIGRSTVPSSLTLLLSLKYRKTIRNR